MPAHYKRIILWTCIGIVVVAAVGLAFRPQPVLVDLFTLFICAVVAWYSAQFVALSREYEDVVLGNVPAWPLQLSRW